MKKILFAAYSLDIGGIEKALVTLINYLVKENEYDITLVLEKKEGILLNSISNKIKIIEYKPCNCKYKIIRKIKNAYNRFKFIIKHKNKYDYAISYATYSLPSSFVARTASRENALWIHSEYLSLFNGDKSKYIEFFNKLNSNSFKSLVFVSKNSMEIFKEIMKVKDNATQNIVHINNIIDYKNIIKKSNEDIKDLNKSDCYTFLFVGRQTEEDKKLSRAIEAAKKLKDDKLKFRIILVGEGRDTNRYKDLVKKYQLDDYIIFLGEKENPYPYFNISDSLILTSEYEGFPVVYIEAAVLELPIITTNVSDSEIFVKNQYGVVTAKDIDSIYNSMKLFIEKGFKIKNKFNPDQFNKEMIGRIEKLFGRTDEKN